MRDVVVVGGGHNGLVAACYLARAGLDVLVVEQSDRLGGGSRTDELVPGHRFDTHSAAHNLVQASGVLEDLRLAELGLRYVEMDPFSVSVGLDGSIIRFSRSVERTVASIAEVAPEDADRYGAGWPTPCRSPTSSVPACAAATSSAGRARRVPPSGRCAATAGRSAWRACSPSPTAGCCASG